jgi:hypothetical protein
MSLSLPHGCLLQINGWLRLARSSLPGIIGIDETGPKKLLFLLKIYARAKAALKGLRTERSSDLDWHPIIDCAPQRILV